MRRRGALLAMGGAAALGAAPLAAGAQSLGQTLLLNAGSEPDTIDPARSSFIGEIEKVMRVFRNLLKIDATGALLPDQAEALPLVEEGGTRLTFRVHDQARYSDGRRVTARDFEYGWKRHLDPRTASPYAFAGYPIVGAAAYNTASLAATPPDTLAGLRDAVGVRALDDRTLEFRLTAPAPWFLYVLATWCGVPVREDRVAAGGSRWTEPATYVGNGPYALVEWDHTSRMRFEANPFFWPAPPQIPAVEYAMIGEAGVAFAAYLNDELDVVGLQREDRPRVSADPRLRAQLHEYTGTCTNYAGFNTARAPFDDPAVRGAFALALDRDSYVTNVLGGQGAPAHQFVPPGFPGHFGDLAGQRFDAAGARRLLAASRYGAALPPIKWAYSSSARSRVRIESLAAQLAQHLGVRIELDPMESRSFTAALKSPDTTPALFVAGWCQDYPDPQNWYSAVFRSRSGISSTGWSHPEFDRLVDQADAAEDPALRAELYRSAAEILLVEAPAAFLYHSVVWLLVKPRVRGYRQDPFEYFFGEHSLDALALAP